MMRPLFRWLWVGILLLPGVLSAQTPTPASKAKVVKVQIISPETPQSWAYGDMDDHKLVWDAAKKEFRAQLVFSPGAYAEEQSAVTNRETYDCPFPGVRFDEASQLFIAKTKKGTDVPLAKRIKVVFGTQIVLLPTSRVTIYNFRGKLVVELSGTTDQAYATGTNKWIVRPQGWYLQNAF